LLPRFLKPPLVARRIHDARRAAARKDRRARANDRSRDRRDGQETIQGLLHEGYPSVTSPNHRLRRKTMYGSHAMRPSGAQHLPQPHLRGGTATVTQIKRGKSVMAGFIAPE
jgi:hypothetical protein